MCAVTKRCCFFFYEFKLFFYLYHFWSQRRNELKKNCIIEWQKKNYRTVKFIQMRCITYRFFLSSFFFINIGFNNNCLVCVHGSFILRPKTFGGYLDYKMRFFIYRIFLLVMPLAKHVFILFCPRFFIDIFKRL